MSILLWILFASAEFEPGAIAWLSARFSCSSCFASFSTLAECPLRCAATSLGSGLSWPGPHHSSFHG